MVIFHSYVSLPEGKVAVFRFLEVFIIVYLGCISEKYVKIVKIH